jgi:enoyl-CoA hydratase
LSRLIGKGRAKEMIFTGEMIDADQACRIGLVNRVVAKDCLMEEAKALAMQMCDKSASAISLSKEAIDNGLEMDFARAARYEADLFALSFTTADCKEGISAFLEKRPAKF